MCVQANVRGRSCLRNSIPFVSRASSASTSASYAHMSSMSPLQAARSRESRRKSLTRRSMTESSCSRQAGRSFMRCCSRHCFAWSRPGGASAHKLRLSCRQALNRRAESRMSSLPSASCRKSSASHSHVSFSGDSRCTHHKQQGVAQHDAHLACRCFGLGRLEDTLNHAFVVICDSANSYQAAQRTRHDCTRPPPGLMPLQSTSASAAQAAASDGSAR